jgi:hypothetical protein
MSVDPLRNKYPAWSPYVYCLDNPMRLVDPDGQTPEERAKAVEKAREYIRMNPKGDAKQHSKSNRTGGPGESSDCSGMAANCVMAAGVKNPNHGDHGGGVLNIIANTRPVATNDVQPGNLATFKVSKTDKHIGVVVDVTRDKDGKVTSFKMDHNSSSSGPIETVVTLNGTEYWDKKVMGFQAWDNPDPKTVTVVPSDAKQFQYVPEKVLP